MRGGCRSLAGASRRKAAFLSRSIKSGGGSTVFKALRLEGESGAVAGPLMEIVSESGVGLAAARLTGSRAFGTGEQARLESGAAGRGTSSAYGPCAASGRYAARNPGRSGLDGHLAAGRADFSGRKKAALGGRRIGNTLVTGGALVVLTAVPPQPTGVCLAPNGVYRAEPYCTAPSGALAGLPARKQNTSCKTLRERFWSSATTGRRIWCALAESFASAGG